MYEYCDFFCCRFYRNFGVSSLKMAWYNAETCNSYVKDSKNKMQNSAFVGVPYRVEPGYKDIGLHDTSSITSDILWYQLISRCNSSINFSFQFCIYSSKPPPWGWLQEWPKHVGGITTFIIYFHKLMCICSFSHHVHCRGMDHTKLNNNRIFTQRNMI
jgi:hypothetical protein